jgi:uncharacterized protein YjbJ (UPF0337 family)
MNENQIKGEWKITKGRVKEKWGKLTDDDLDTIDGQADQLSGAIQKRYGRTQEEAEREIREWRRQA